MTLFLIIFISAAFLLPLTLNEENADFLMAGYNTMSDKQKKDVDLVALLKYMNRYFPIVSLLNLALGGLLYIFVKNEESILIILLSFMMISFIYFFVKSKQFYLSKELKESNTSIYLLIAVLLFTIGLLSLNFLK